MIIKLITLIMLSLTAIHVNANDNNVRFMVSWSPGGGVDSITRIIAAEIENRSSIKVLIENRVGANGSIGAAHVAKSKLDQNYFMIEQTTLLLNHWLQKDFIVYNPLTDIVPIAHIAEQHLVLAVPQNSPFNSYEDLIRSAKENPSKVSFGHAGTGNISNIIMSMIASRERVSFNEITYKSALDALKDLAGGHIDATIGNATAMSVYSSTGKVKVLSKFSPQGPDNVPLSKVNHKVDLLLFVPTLNANTETTKTVKKLIVEILKSEDVRRRIAVTGQTVSSSNEDQIKNTVQSNLDAWKKAGIY